MAAQGLSEKPPAPDRRQLNLRLRGADYELLENIMAATGLPAAQVVRLLIRQGARRLVIEDRARRREEENWRQYLRQEEARFRLPPGA